MKRRVLLGFFAVAVVVLAVRVQDGTDVTRDEDAVQAVVPLRPRVAEPKRWVPPSQDEEPATLPASAPVCAPDASAHCFAGLLVAFDSCGKRGELLDDCGGRGCVDDVCVPPAVGPACGSLTEIGRCVEGGLEYCERGVMLRVDCSRMGRTCGVGLDGEAACLPPPPKLCAQLPAVGRCEGNTASICQGGRLVVKQCTLGSHCSTEGGAHCEWVTPFLTTAAANAGCTLCGCTAVGPLGGEVCDGFDNDGDGSVDNGAACQAIEIRAIVVRDRYGQPSATSEQITAEIQSINNVYAATGHDTGLRFLLGETMVVDKPGWISADDTTINEALAEPSFFAAPFRVPVIFTQSLSLDGKLHPGVSTLANGTCADLQLPHWRENGNGLVIVAHRRWDTTVAHELGHYFGLCHTHQPTLARDVIRHDTPTASYRCADCVRTGDGVCDTPYDPGLDQCTIDDSCVVSCPMPFTPDVTNVMSYYTGCRGRFSPEQTLQMHRYFARRQRWQVCAIDPSSCACSAAAPCPSGMMMHCDPTSQVCVPD